MSKRKNYIMSEAQRRQRHFSDGFKISKVREIESGSTKVTQICKEYEVSATAVYAWIEKFGTMKNKPERLIVESQSDTAELLLLRKKVADLERVIGQKQVLLDFKEKMIELAEEEYGVDIKKKFITGPWSISGKTGRK